MKMTPQKYAARLLPLLLTAALAATGAVNAMAEPTQGQATTKEAHKKAHGEHHERGKKMKHRGFERLAERLQLSDAQREDIKEIMRSGHKNTKGGRLSGPEYSKLFSGDPGSAEYQREVYDLGEKAANRARKHIEQRAAQYQAMYSLLDENQRETWATIQSELREKHAERQAKREDARKAIEE